MRYSALFPSILFLLMAPCSSEAQCTGAIQITPAENWLTPILPPSPSWVGNVPPVGPGTMVPPPCNATFPGENCYLCPASWITEISTDKRALIYLCAGNRYDLSTCGTTEMWDSHITITNAAGAVVYGYDDDGCGSVDGHAYITFQPPVSAAYAIRVSNSECATTPVRNARLTISCDAGSCPGIGDNPCATSASPSCNPNIAPCPETVGAIALNVSATDCMPQQASTAGYTGTQNIATPSCGVYPNAGDIWFTVVLPASGSVRIEVQHLSATNLAMAWYTAADCQGPFTIGTCNADIVPGTIREPRLTIDRPDLVGSTIHIRVWPEANVANGGTFTICARELDAPANNNPCMAAVLPITTECEPLEFTLLDASTEQGLSFNPASPTCGSPMVYGDVWFTSTLPLNEPYRVEMNGAPGSMLAIAAYELGASPCTTGPYVQFACVAAASGSSTLVLHLPIRPAGTTIHLRVWDSTDPSGTASICLAPTPRPVNDEPCGAFPIEAIYGCLSTYADMTNSTLSLGVSTPSCVNGMPDIWYTVQVPENGGLGIDTDDLGVNDAAMVVYRVLSGSCGSDDLVLQEVPLGCRTSGSMNTGAAGLPAFFLSGLTPGETLYLRLLNETNFVGGVALCAKRSDQLANLPGVQCYNTLLMNDSGGDGWDGSFVTITLGGVQTNYTIIAGSGTISFPVTQGQPYLIMYTPVGGSQNQISYSVITHQLGLVYSSPSGSPTAGIVSSGAGDCNYPPNSISDCYTANPWSTSSVLTNSTFLYSVVEDLNTSNRGCLLADEGNGHWYHVIMTFTGPFGMEITPAPNTDMDFALWGPNDLSCPPVGPPLRCSSAALTGPTGMDFTAMDPSEGPAGDGWVQSLDVQQGDVYVLYVSANSTVVETYMLQRLVPTSTADHDTRTEAIQVFPNPTDGNSLSITTAAPTHGTPTLRIFDSAGRVVRGEKLMASAGTASVQISIEELSAGTYVIELIEESGSSLGRSPFVKLAP